MDLRRHPHFAEITQEVLAHVDERPIELTIREKLSLKFAGHLDWLGFSYEQWSQELQNEIDGWGPISHWLENDQITEICINSSDCVFYFQKGVMHKSAEGFASSHTYLRFIQRLLRKIQKSADIRHPIVDGTFTAPSGAVIRAHICLPPISASPIVTLRVHNFKKWKLESLLEFEMFDRQILDIFKLWIEQKLNILICGPTDSGKTTLLRALMTVAATSERIISLEDTWELGVVSPLHVPLFSRRDPEQNVPEVELSDLLKQSLRMRPDRIVVGEIRGSEALILLDALSTGHAGSMGTIHARSSAHGLKRLESLALRGHPQMNLKTIRQTVLDGIQALVVCGKIKGQRRVTELALLKGAEDFGYLLEPLYRSP